MSLQCIRTFAQSRPPGIYKQDYIESLYTFYNEKRPEPLICPSTPEWKRPTEVDLNGEAKHDEEDDDDESILAALQVLTPISSTLLNSLRTRRIHMKLFRVLVVVCLLIML